MNGQTRLPYRVEAQFLARAAEIASGHGEYGLANQLWAFEAQLREKSREE